MWKPCGQLIAWESWTDIARVVALLPVLKSATNMRPALWTVLPIPGSLCLRIVDVDISCIFNPVAAFDSIAICLAQSPNLECLRLAMPPSSTTFNFTLDASAYSLGRLLRFCSADRPLRLKQLALSNVYFTVDARTLPHLKSLRVLSPILSPHLFEADSPIEWPIGPLRGTGIELEELAMSMGGLEAIGVDTLQYLASYSGLQKVDLLGVNEHSLSQLFAPAVMPRHATTLRELHIQTHGRSWFEPCMVDVALIATCVRLRSLKICVCCPTPDVDPGPAAPEYESGHIAPNIVSPLFCLAPSRAALT